MYNHISTHRQGKTLIYNSKYVGKKDESIGKIIIDILNYEVCIPIDNVNR